MSWPQPDRLHRTGKALVDSGRAKDPEHARQILESLVLQVAVGADLAADPAAQASLATIVNAGCRAFLGGVHVQLDDDPLLATGWTSGVTAGDVARRFGGQVVGRLANDRPTLTVARPAAPTGAPLLHVTYSGWVGGVVESPDAQLLDPGMALAGITAGALGVSEVFQHQLGASVPGRRDVGISLWRPDLSWRDPDAAGPALDYLPSRLWLLALGHLGQAYAWSLGMLPFADPTEVHIGLVDFDDVIDGNTATQLLVTQDDIGTRKTRVVAAALERLGLRTTIVERAFDDQFRPDLARGEPTTALAGFDKREPRLLLGGDRFDRVVDCGLGAGPVDYLDMVLHSFPATETPAAAFAAKTPTPHRAASLPAAYEAEIARQTEAGADEDAVRCGMLDIAGVSVGAAFVGAFAGSLVVADLLRLLHGGIDLSVVAVDLRDPANLRAIPNASPSQATPAFVPAQA